MEDRLRECPCGHSAHIIFEDGTKVSDPWSIACKNFDCPWVFQTFPSREKAISAWNTRATDPLLEEMKEELKRLYTKIDEDRFAALADDSVPRLVFHAAIEAIANKDALLEKMVEALERIDQWDWNVILQYSECDKEVFDDLKNVEQALQKYREAAC